MTSETLALYRKYRPQSFKEVLDQDHIVNVLEGAIKKGEIPHAILFSGSRGTGKTTLARIFAKEIGTSSLDLYEIDAASNRGIDDIRELKEAVHTLPYESQYKVYIIDEVHMLTKEAFNALLKTLEEPPAHVVFMLATTEADKLLDTILSRCQVFTLHSPSREVLASVVTNVAKKEGFKLDKDAADLIALSADGSFRDVLGVIQKVILASGDTIGSVDEVATIIGAPKAASLRCLIEALAEKNLEKGMEAIEEAVDTQVNIKLFSRLVLERVRAVILLRNIPDTELKAIKNLSESELEYIQSLAKAEGSAINSHLLVKLLDASIVIPKVNTPRIPLELLLLDVCR
ncbi:DNA polymerase III, subunit gamma and tau [bacterium]|nr:DNA polymerase III, subunit gamma and tau [bacterium]